MSFLAPFWLGVAAIAAAGIFAMHLITTRRPPPAPLPTARFVPGGDARSASRANRPADLLLLALRIAALLLLGAAFARPVSRPGGSALARVVVVDRSRSAQADVRDSAVAVWHEGDLLVVADSGARVVREMIGDTLRALRTTSTNGSLSAALAAARRAATELAGRADSVELVIVSPLTADEFDAASRPFIVGWPGRVRVARTRAAAATRPVVALVSPITNDPLTPAVSSLAGEPVSGERARIVRRDLTSADTAFAHDGAVVIHWPSLAGGTVSAQGVWTIGVTVVAPLGRRAIDTSGVAIARWADGTPAVTERAVGAGCLREVGIGVPVAGDLTLQPAFGRLFRAITLACGVRAIGEPIADSVLTPLIRTGSAAPARAFVSGDESSPLAPWLIGAALLALGAEWLARRERKAAT